MATLYSQAANNVRKTFALIFVFALVIIFLGWLFGQIFDSSFLFTALFL